MFPLGLVSGISKVLAEIVKRDKDNKSRLCLGAFGFVRGAVKFGGEGG